MRAAVAVIATGAALAVTGVAHANTISPRLALQASFSTTQPARPTAYTLALSYGAGGQPPGVRMVVVHAPTGTRFAPARPGACTATDSEAMVSQGAACPESSRVGQGTFTAFSGLGAPVDPVQGTTEVFRTPTGLLELARAGGSPAVVGTDRFAIDGAFLRAAPPSLPGVGPRGTTTFGRLALTLADTALTTTPASCPPTGAWVTQAAVTFDDGVTETETASTPCRSALTAPRIVLSPSRATAGRPTTVRLRLAGGSPGCRAGAALRIGTRHTRTGADGRVRIRLRLRRSAGVTARARGCPRSVAHLPVRRAG